MSSAELFLLLAPLILPSVRVHASMLFQSISPLREELRLLLELLSLELRLLLRRSFELEEECFVLLPS